MAKPNNQFEKLARKAVERLEQARALGEQMELLPADPADDAEPVARGRGRARSKSQLRKWLEAQHYRAPEEVLAEAAGLASQHDAFATAMIRTQQIEAFAGANLNGGARVQLFMSVFAAQIRSAEALLPYVAAKMDKPAAPVQAVQVIMPAQGAQAAPGDGARVINAPKSGRFTPPPMPGQSKQNQEDSE
ncbi:MAG: hypothetical protein ACK4LQ_02180 [Pararhodobacter sp.]